jgi:hypothetical protein
MAKANRLTQSPRAIREGNADPYHHSSDVSIEQTSVSKYDDANKGVQKVEKDLDSYNAPYEDGSGIYA